MSTMISGQSADTLPTVPRVFARLAVARDGGPWLAGDEVRPSSC
jgi:hypothetical protein